MDELKQVLSRLEAMEKHLKLLHDDVRRTGEATSRIQMRIEKLTRSDGGASGGAEIVNFTTETKTDDPDA